jgi:hypothetical protein
LESAFLTGLALAVAVGMTPALARLAVRTPAAGICLVGLPLIVGLAVDIPTVELGAVGIDLKREPVGMLLLGAGLYRLSRQRLSSAHLIVIGFGALFTIAFLRGVLTYGFTGHLEFSGLFLLMSGLTYGVTFGMSAHERVQILRSLTWLSCLSIIIVLASWSGILGDGGQIPALPALLFGQTGVLYLLRAIERARPGPGDYAISGALIGIAVLLQHRTVWVALLVALAVLGLSAGRRLSRIAIVVAALLAVGVVVQLTGLVTPRSGFEAPSLAESLVVAAQDDRTYEWRQDYWRYTLETHRGRGSVAVATGAGFGAPWMTFGPLIDRLEGPHNQYIEIVVRFGLVGLVAWVWVLAWTGLRLWRHRRRGCGTGLSNFGLLTLLLMQATWSITYWMDDFQPLLLGLVIAAAANQTMPSLGSSQTSVDGGWAGHAASVSRL